MEETMPGSRVHVALILLSAALIGFQLEQMQVLALVQWHHFAYLIISVALLGFGASGTCIALFRPFLLRHLSWLLPVLMFGCSLFMALALPLSGSMTQGLDVSLFFVEPLQAVYLSLSQGIYLLVFFLGALPMGIVFIAYSHRINSLYSANLVGSGLGGLGAILLMTFLLPQQLPAVTALLPWAAGCLVATNNSRVPTVLAGMLSLAVIVVFLFQPPQLRPSQYKDSSRILDLPGAEIVATQPDPQGLVQLVSAPALRHAPGLSLTYEKEVPEAQGVILNNGDWFGAVINGDPGYRRETTAALPYAMGQRQRVLFLQAGTGTGVSLAKENGAKTIVAVEPHQKAARLASVSTGRPDTASEEGQQVEYVYLHPRTWLARNKESYDLISLPIVGRFGGSSGLLALHEQYLLTREGISAIWQSLSPEGVLQVSTWHDTPSRHTLRLAATIWEALEEDGVRATKHIAALGNWNLATFIVKRSPLTDEDLVQIRRFCSRLQFDPILLPDLRPEERQRFHFVADPEFFQNIDAVSSPSKRQLVYDRHAFDVRPVRDNRPFFSQFLRWQSLAHLVRLFGERTVPFLELGYLIVLVSFVQMLAAAILLILLPLLYLEEPGAAGLQRWAFPYFGALGLGYMFFEIVLIHKLTLFFGHPIYAAGAGISSLLIYSGLGSSLSYRFRDRGVNHGTVAFLAAAILLLYGFILPSVFEWAIVRSMLWKMCFVLLVIAPPAIVMGMPFPLGLARLAGHSKSQAAWAWGINGCVSVVSAGLATIVAVEFGFSAVMFIACGAYVVAALTALRG